MYVAEEQSNVFVTSVMSGHRRNRNEGHMLSVYMANACRHVPAGIHVAMLLLRSHAKGKFGDLDERPLWPCMIRHIAKAVVAETHKGATLTSSADLGKPRPGNA